MSVALSHGCGSFGVGAGAAGARCVRWCGGGLGGGVRPLAGPVRWRGWGPALPGPVARGVPGRGAVRSCVGPRPARAAPAPARRRPGGPGPGRWSLAARLPLASQDRRGRGCPGCRGCNNVHHRTCTLLQPYPSQPARRQPARRRQGRRRQGRGRQGRGARAVGGAPDHALTHKEPYPCHIAVVPTRLPALGSASPHAPGAPPLVPRERRLGGAAAALYAKRFA